MPETLAQKWRAKYPGAYDDLSDADLEAKIDTKYPGAYDDLPRSGKAPSGPLRAEAGVAGGSGGAEGKPSDAGARFAAGAWGMVNPVNMVKGVGQLVAHPIDTLSTAAGQMSSEWEKAGVAGMEGRTSEAIGHGLAGSLPFVGPAAAAAGEKIGGGDIAGGLGEGVGLIGSMFMPKVAGKAIKGVKVGGTTVGLLPAVNKLRAPFAGQIDTAVEAAAKRTGIEMPASALSTSRVVPVAEAVAAKGLGGGRTMGRITAAAGELTSRANHLVARASKFAEESQRGASIAEGLSEFRKAWIRNKNALYKDAAIPEGLGVNANKTVALLDEILKSKEGAAKLAGGATDLNYFETLRAGLGKGTVKLADLRSALQDLNGKIGGAHADAWSAANKQLLKKVAATMSDDFESSLRTGAPDVAAKLDAANSAYRDGLSKINSTFGKTITKLAQQGAYDKIGRAVASAKMSADHIPGILEVAGPEGAEAIRASVLSDIIGRAKNTAGELTPQGIGSAMKNWERSSPGALDALLTPEQMSSLRDLSTLSRSLDKVGRVTGGSQTAFLGRIGGYAAGLAANPAFTLKAMLGDAAFSRFVGSAAGQRWLTRGFKPWSIADVDNPAGRVGSMATAAVGANERR